MTAIGLVRLLTGEATVMGEIREEQPAPGPAPNTILTRAGDGDAEPPAVAAASGVPDTRTQPAGEIVPIPPEQPLDAPPRWVLPLVLGYVLGLVALLLLYLHVGWLRDLVPDPLGPIPLAVPWWGAMGAVMISLTGVFFHARRWLPSYNPWHIARPVVGAILGTVGYLIFISVIRATGIQESPGDTTTGAAIIYLVAFIVGYREELFRQMIQRAADLLFSAQESSPVERDR